MSLRPIFYDTETTGISASKDRIVEIAAFDPVQNKSFCSLIHPGVLIPNEASSIHGITDEMVKDKENFARVGKAFFDFCSGDTVLIAHNNDAFDLPFLDQEARRHGLLMPSFRTIDSLIWARKYRPDLPRHSLQFLRQVYGIEEMRAHRALDDVLVLKDVFFAMIDDLTMEEVISLLPNKK